MRITDGTETMEVSVREYGDLSDREITDQTLPSLVEWAETPGIVENVRRTAQRLVELFANDGKNADKVIGRIPDGTKLGLGIRLYAPDIRDDGRGLPDDIRLTRYMRVGRPSPGVVVETKDNMRALAALKKKGYEVGALKPVKSFDSIPLKQPGRTYRLRGNYIRINRIPGLMRLTGMKQLDGWEIGPAKLLRKASGYYVAFSCFKDKTAYEKEQPYTPAPVNPIGGVDAGLKDEIVESDGTKTTRRYPDSRKARYWARRMSKRDKSSRGWWKANRTYRMEHERLAARRKHAAIEESQRLTRKYATLVIQNEQIRTWNKNKGYARGGRKIHAGILGRLYANLKQQQNVIILDKWQPTTSWCRNCGRRTPCPVNLRTYTCAYCGVREDRDQHAALNMTVLRLAPLSYTDLRKARDIPIGPYQGNGITFR